MPLHLIPQTRRRFLQSTATGSAAFLASSRIATAESQAKSSWWALLADTHIDANPTTRARGATMFDNLNRVIDEILAEESRPEGVIINGDCAYLKGRPGDYATLSKAIQRLADGELSVHMTMGNHDDRGPFYKAFRQHRPDNPLVDGKHVSMLSSPAMNIFLVDSLREVNNVTGELGGPQIEWLTKALDAHRQKPAIVVGHHNLQFVPEGSKQRVTGLNDSQQLIDALHARPHVQAYVFGHTHNWNVRPTDRHLHLINLPPCAYVFNPSRPNGWVRAEMSEEHFTLELRALDRSHSEHGQKHKLSYRSAAATP